jgi:hypothetical protein
MIVGITLIVIAVVLQAVGVFLLLLAIPSESNLAFIGSFVIFMLAVAAAAIGGTQLWA